MSSATPARPTSDRNLLFGVLAVQMDLVTRDQLIAAMNAWVLDKARPLGEIFREQHALDDEEQALLDGLVRKHLPKHGDDPARSLAAIALAGALLHDLQQIADPDLHASLRHVGSASNAARWMRRHQTAVAACVAALLVAVLAVGVGVWWMARLRREQQAVQRLGVEAALAEVEQLQWQARWREARVVLEQAMQRMSDGGPPDLKARLKRAADELDLVQRLEEIRLGRAIIVEGRFDTAGADRAYEEVFRAAGLGEAGTDPGAAAAWVRHSSVAAPLVAALDDWAACAGEGGRRSWVLEVARRADPDPWRDGVRDPAAWDDAAVLARRVQGEQATEQSPQLLAALGMRLRGKAAEELLKGALRRHPGDFWINLALGNAVREGKKATEAASYYRAALALRPGTVAVHLNLGDALRAQGRMVEAVAEYRQAIALDPQLARAHSALGMTLLVQGLVPEAMAEFHKAITLAPDDLGSTLRYDAACAAARAAAGRGEAAAKLDDKERARLRQEALGWLRADLALLVKQVEGGTPQAQVAVQKTLEHWKEDAGLAGMRDAAALAKLPEAERAEWNKLWAEVEATLKKAVVPDKK
jgi:tetratricopeptide (TPR) repeat protein